jgi:putative flavoprotein involved in K+ transport
MATRLTYGLADWMSVVVVGAGPAGLAASRELARRGREHVVLERDRVGWSWRTQRWDSFRLNSPTWMNRVPAEHQTTARDEFASAGALVAAFERFARDLPVMEGVDVMRADRVSNVWRLQTSRGTFVANDVVVASGFQNVPRLPDYAGELPHDVKQLHVADYRSPSDVDGAVLVVGGGQSGVQIADELVDAGHRLYLATSRVGRLPRRYRGRDAFEWMRDAGQLDLPTDVADEAAIAATPPQISGRHTMSYQDLARRGATLLGRAVGWDGKALELTTDVGANVRFADDASRRVRDMWDACGRQGGPVERDAADEPAPHLYGLRGPRSLDLAYARIGTIIWATGFDPSTQWLPAGALDLDGRPRVPGLHVIGAPWLTHRSSGNLWGMTADAERLAQTLTATDLRLAA